MPKAEKIINSTTRKLYFFKRIKKELINRHLFILQIKKKKKINEKWTKYNDVFLKGRSLHKTH